MCNRWFDSIITQNTKDTSKSETRHTKAKQDTPKQNKDEKNAE